LIRTLAHSIRETPLRSVDRDELPSLIEGSADKLPEALPSRIGQFATAKSKAW
jgi:hypothetical protein